jgi:hypothetical protein
MISTEPRRTLGLVAQWLVLIKQSRVRFPPGTRPSAQREEIICPDAGDKYLAQEEHPSGEQLEDENIK